VTLLAARPPLPRSLYLETTSRGNSLCETGIPTFGGREPEKDRPWSACRRPWSLVSVTVHGHVLRCRIAPFLVPGEWYWIWPLLTLPQFTFAACGAGRVAGVDAVLRRSLDPADDSAWQRLLRVAT
jgi:hypothetical protein